MLPLLNGAGTEVRNGVDFLALKAESPKVIWAIYRV